MNTITSSSSFFRVAFIGGGNMASAIIGGLRQAGWPAEAITVLEPWAEQAQRLRDAQGVHVIETAEARLADAAVVVWAVKPQMFAQAAAACAPFIGQALQLSVMAGIRSDAIVNATGAARVVRTMPNTPALVGQGMTGLCATAAVSAAERAQVEQLLAPTGALLWVEAEAQLDAVTALSGSGPAYVFFFIEAMMQAGTELGTFSGAAALAGASSEAPEVLRQRVTSKGGTTYAAITSMEAAGVKPAFVEAMHAAAQRAQALGDEFGRA
jgi:pyrroline-5-carboxylate reductase